MAGWCLQGDRYRVYMRVNNGNWQFTKTLCPGIKRKLSGEPRLQGKEGRKEGAKEGMIRVVIFRAASTTTLDIFTASLHDTKLEITLTGNFACHVLWSRYVSNNFHVYHRALKWNFHEGCASLWLEGQRNLSESRKKEED